MVRVISTKQLLQQGAEWDSEGADGIVWEREAGEMLRIVAESFTTYADGEGEYVDPPQADDWGGNLVQEDVEW